MAGEESQFNERQSSVIMNMKYLLYRQAITITLVSRVLRESNWYGGLFPSNFIALNTNPTFFLDNLYNNGQTQEYS